MKQPIRRLRLAAALVAAALLSGAPNLLPHARAQDDPTTTAKADEAAVKAALQAIYAARDGFIKNKDLKQLLALEAPNYTQTDAKGRTLTRAEADAQLEKQWAQFPPIDKCLTTINSIQSGADGLVTVEATTVIEATLQAPDNSKHAIQLTGTMTDVWTPVTGQPAYLNQSTVEGKTIVTVDGNVVPLGD